MKQFITIRKPHEKDWRVEEYDTEYQIASYWKDRYKSKADAVKAINEFIMKPEFKAEGEIGEWIHGSL